MPTVQLTQNLQRFFPGIGEPEVGPGTVASVLLELDARYPGIRGYVVGDDGALRKHVHVFVDGEMVTDRATLSDAVGPSTELHIIQALSGG